MDPAEEDTIHRRFAGLYSHVLTGLGIRIATTPLPRGDVARWDPHHGILHIKPTATHEDQIWVLRDFVKATLHGTACADARPVPAVALVS